MFYWDHKGLFVLLTDKEENEIILSLSDNDPRTLLEYDANYEARKFWENKINNYLKNYMLNNLEEFTKKYVIRSWYNEEAQTYFPKMLDAYGRATKLATIGSYDGDKLLDDAAENILFDSNEDIYHITLFNKSIFRRKIPRVNGRISFYTKNIEKITGSVSNFVLMTKHFNIRFGEKLIRISFFAK